MARILSRLCTELSKNRQIMDVLYDIYGAKLPYVMLYSTVLVTMERLGDYPELKVALNELKRYDPVNIVNINEQHLMCKLFRKAMLKAVRSEAERIIAKAVENVIKKSKGIDINDIVAEATKELDRLISGGALERSLPLTEYDVPQQKG